MSRFAEFTRERRYLHNVSDNTVRWYTHAFKWLPSESPTQDELKQTVMRMREKGLKETGCNAVIRAVNAYLHWASGSERKCGAGCTHPRMQQLKEPQNILPTLSEDQIRLIVGWRPGKGFYRRRLHLLALVLLDTGCRISEALGVRASDVDLDNLLINSRWEGPKATNHSHLIRPAQGPAPLRLGLCRQGGRAAIRHPRRNQSEANVRAPQYETAMRATRLRSAR